MCLKCGALYPLYVKSGVIRKQTAELTCFFSHLFLVVIHLYNNLFGFTSADLAPILHLSTSDEVISSVEGIGHMTHVTILFEASWRIT